MSKNQNMKLNNLKINTNLDNMYESKSPSTNLKKTQINIISPKKNNYNSNNNHAPSLSSINNSLLLNNCKLINEERNSMMSVKNLRQRSNSKNAFQSSYQVGQSAQMMQTNQNSQITKNNINANINLQISHNNITKAKTEIDLDSKYYKITSTFSPKSAKANPLNSTNNLVQNNINNKFVPLSTRGIGSQVSNFNSMNSTKNVRETNAQAMNNSNYNSNSPLSVMSLLGSQNNTPITLKNLNAPIPNYETSKSSTKSMTVLKAYAANTHQGIIRTYNEDRVSIILNIVKQNSFTGDVWPKCSFFGIYDGHGGASCADFLRDSLHQYIVKDQNFPVNVNEAIRRGFETAEREFLNNKALNKLGEVLDRSGSCAVVAMIVDNMCYIANVGDSRAVMSCDLGNEVRELTNDHKPNDPNEKKRIIEAGGKVYQTQTPAKNFNISFNNVNNNQILLGPHRVFPGRLSVSRTLGDVEAKLTKFGGMPNVIIAIPEIKSFEIKSNMDFIILGCDGIFDQLNNNEVIKGVWMTMEENRKAKNIHSQSGLAIDMILKSSLVRKTLDNVTCVMIAFSNFEKIFNSETNYNSNVNKTVNVLPLIEEKEKYNTNQIASSNIELIEETEKKLSATNPSYSKINSISNKRSESQSNMLTTNKLEDKKTPNHKYESSNSTLNYESSKYGSVDLSNHKKNTNQKKLLSIDLSSSKKGGSNISSNKVETPSNGEIHNKKKLDYSEQIESKKTPYVINFDLHPYTTKNTKSKENNLIGSIRKVSSVKGIEEK